MKNRLLTLLFFANVFSVCAQTKYCVTVSPSVSGTTVTLSVQLSIVGGSMKLGSSSVDINYDATKVTFSSGSISPADPGSTVDGSTAGLVIISSGNPSFATAPTSATATITFINKQPGSVTFSASGPIFLECADSNCNTSVTTADGTCSNSGSLPISLTTFQAAPLPSAIALDWGSTNELNFSGFEVERSMDGKSFEKIAWVAAKGGVSVAEYKHLDQTAQRGMTYYYRLKMVDNDGIFKYSPVRTARLGEGTINAFPNPSGGQYTIALERTRSAEGTVTVTDVMGKTVKMERRTLDAALTLDLNALPDGVYHVKIDDGAAAQTVRVVKQ
jgi:hypothetical protein